jgi:hypothetical protein
MGAEGRRLAEVGMSAAGWTATAAVLWMLAVAPVAVLALVARTGSRSRVVAWLSPALIVMLYALAVSLWQPH